MRIDQKALAVVGARVRLSEIESERKALLAAFPALRTQARPPAAGPAPPKGAKKTVTARKSSSWSAAQRKAVAVRMKKYWAARRAQEAKKAKATKPKA